MIRRYLEALGVTTGFAVDIAAGDGRTMSNTLALFEKGWTGLAVERDPVAFAKLAKAYESFDVSLSRMAVAPSTVADLLRSHGVPHSFTFLSLDIDGYDSFVLREILSHFRPRLVCTEINETIPPPLRFTVKWSPEFAWAGDHFFGQSISLVSDLAEEMDYVLLELNYCNAFLAPRELAPQEPITPEEAYSAGYRSEPTARSTFRGMPTSTMFCP